MFKRSDVNQPEEEFIRLNYFPKLFSAIVMTDKEYIYNTKKDFFSIRQWVKERLIVRPHVEDMLIDYLTAGIYGEQHKNKTNYYEGVYEQEEEEEEEEEEESEEDKDSETDFY